MEIIINLSLDDQAFGKDHHRSSYCIVHQLGSCFLFSFVISKVMMSHENTQLSVFGYVNYQHLASYSHSLSSYPQLQPSVWAFQSTTFACQVQYSWPLPEWYQYHPRSGLGDIDITQEVVRVIGASLSEPHTSGTALRTCVCMFACLLACGHIP